MASLNEYLIRRYKVTPERVADLHRLHAEKDALFDRAENKTESMRFLLLELKVIEYDMQHAWGFVLDTSRHTWKYLMPGTPYTPEPGSWASEYLSHG